MHRFLLPLLLALVAWSSPAGAEQIRDVAEIHGARDNQLVGYGVIVGLSGTGDNSVSAPLATQSTLAMLRRLGVQVDSRQLRLRNIAAVMVTATIPAFAKPGTKLDVTVASIGNARSIQGGVLVQTVLKGADRKSYAIAQGSVVLGGFGASGKSGSSVSSGSTTAGRVPQGALVEREIPTKFVFGGKLQLSLRQPSFVMTSRVAKVINAKLGDGVALSIDGGTVMVKVPKAQLKTPVDLIATVQGLEVESDVQARIVVSERTQTIVAGGDVRLAPVAVVHGNLTIVVKETPVISQPGPLANAGETTRATDSDVAVEEQTTNMKYLDGAASLADLTRVLGTLGLSARELISVLQALRTSGALRADLIVQ